MTGLHLCSQLSHVASWMGTKSVLMGCNISKVYKQQTPPLMYGLQNIVAALKMPQCDKEKFYVNYGEKVLHGENLKGKKEVADLSATEVADDWET